eukprot:2087765-Pyramimonas_sp.AAC.2
MQQHMCDELCKCMFHYFSVFSNSLGTRRATWIAREETGDENKVLDYLCIPSPWGRLSGRYRG